MAQQGRGLFMTIAENFIKSLRPRQFKGTLVGKDHLGNTYYQIAQSDGQKEQRWFDPKTKEDFQQEIPAEWESWLRYRRTKPPLEEEVLANAALASQKKINAAKLEAEKKPRVDVPQITAAKTGYESFPKYEEYENNPGDKQRD